MKLRHAAALALMGWYLMTPAINPSPGQTGTPAEVMRTGHFYVVPDAPLSKWEIQGSFDTASDCEEAQTALFKEGKRDRGRFKSGSWEWAWANASLMALCIATDDPRLTAK